MRFPSDCLAAEAATALSAGAALAGGVAPVVVEPAPVVIAPAAPPLDWSGFYAGASIARLDTSGTVTTSGAADSDLDFDDGSVPGLFAGYNWQAGNFVFGGELAYGFTSDAVLSGSGGAPVAADGDGVGPMLDVFARGGYAFQRALVYAKIGYSRTSYDGGMLNDMEFDGLAYGLGVDFAATDNIVVGLDWTRRNLDGDDSLAPAEVELDASTIALRVAYKF